MLQFAWRVERVNVHNNITCTQNARHHHRVLGHIGHHDGNTVALGQAQTLQIGGKCLAQTVGLGIGHILAHEVVGHPFGELFEAFLHQRHERNVRCNIDIGSYAFGVTIEPNPVCHACYPNVDVTSHFAVQHRRKVPQTSLVFSLVKTGGLRLSAQ